MWDDIEEVERLECIKILRGVLCTRACLEGIVSWLVSCWYWEKYWGAAHDLSEGERSTKREVAGFDDIRGGFRAFKTEEVSGKNKEGIVRDSGREREGRILLARGQFLCLRASCREKGERKKRKTGGS